MNIDIKLACSLFMTKFNASSIISLKTRVCLIRQSFVNRFRELILPLTLFDHAVERQRFAHGSERRGGEGLGARCVGRGDGRIKADEWKHY